MRPLFFLAPRTMLLVITFVELANAKLLFPPPAGMDWNDSAAVAAFAASLPAAAVTMVLFEWLLAWLAARLAQNGFKITR